MSGVHAIQEPAQKRERRSTAMLVGAMSLVWSLTLGAAWAYWAPTAAAGSNGASAATSVNAGATPTAGVVSTTSINVSWAATTLTSGGAVSGYLIKRYNGSNVVQVTGAGCSGTITALTCTETGVPTGTWTYSVTPIIGTNWQGTESAKSSSVSVDSTAPTNSNAVNELSGDSVRIGNNIYYRGVAAGSFTLTNTVTDANSGPASSQSSLTGTSTGWSHTGSTVSTPSGGPFVSNAFSWTAGTTSNPSAVITGRDVAGNSVVSTFPLINDSTAPTPGTVSYTDGYQAARTVTVTVAAGTDAGTGLDTRWLQRAQAALSNGTCGTFGSFVNIGTVNPTSPYTDSGVLTGACYKYRYVVTDRVGNQDIATSANVAKIDYAGAIGATAGLLSWWRFGETAITSSDNFTDTTGVTLSSHTSQDGTTWTRRTGDTPTLVITDADRLRMNSAGTVSYYTNEIPTTADYLVEADIHVKSLVTGDFTGVIGRMDPSATGAGTFYQARYRAQTQQWELHKMVDGVGPTTLATFPVQTLAANGTYRVGLEMIGSSIRLLVDGAVVISATDSSITGAGRAGVRLLSTTVPTNTTGMHLDNFIVSPIAVDSAGANEGDYRDGVTLGTSGAVTGNTAATFDGADDHMRVPIPTGLPVGAAARTVEVWFKTPGVAAGQGRQALFTYGTNADTQAFGVWLESNGTSIKAWGGGASDRTLTWGTPFNDNAWHHFAITYDGTSVNMYVDGVLGGGNKTATRNTVSGAYGFGAAAQVDPTSLATTSYFNGSLDELAFYTTAFDQTTVTNHYQLGSSGTPDVAGPTGGSVFANGLVGTGSLYSTSPTLSIGFAAGSDPSGVAPSGAELLRSTTTLTSTGGANGVCGTYGAYSLVTGGTDPVSPKSESVSWPACHRYQYVVQDIYGNTTTYTSGDIKVDTTAPSTPTLAYSAMSQTYWSAAAPNVVYYQGVSPVGQFTVTASSTDSASGIASTNFPALGTGWAATPGASGVVTYSWSAANPAAPGTKSVTTTNNAGLTSTGASFTLTDDSTAPTPGTLSYASGNNGSTSVTLTFTAGTDAGSGINRGTLQRATATRGATGCGSFGSFTTISGGLNATSPHVNTIAAGTCYQYRYVVTDNVGNFHVASNSNVVYVSTGANWNFDAGAGTTATDSTGNGNTATLQAGAAWAAGKVGTNALSTNGTATSWASSPYAVVDTSSSYSVAAWVKLNTLVGQPTFVAMDGDSASPFYLQKLNGGGFRFVTTNVDNVSATSTAVTSPTVPTVGVWYHLVGVYDDAAGTMKLYVNGTAQGTTATGISGWAATGATTIGRAKWNGTPVDYANAAIDEVKFFDSALTQAQVSALATSYSSLVSGTSGLVNYFRLGEASGTSAADSFGTNTGTYVNAPTYSVTGAIPSDSNTAITFNGVDEYVSANRTIADNFSIEFWFKSTAGTGTGAQWWNGAGLVDAEVNGAANDFGISLRSDGRIVGGVGTPDVSVVSTGSGFNDGNWHHVVFTRNKTTGLIQLWVDGNSQGTATGSLNTLSSNAVINMGRLANGNNHYAGSLDEVALYNVVLTEATIDEHYAAR